MDALILSGGQGTRLRGLVEDRPKTMAEVKGTPFLDLLLELLENSGFTRIILCLGYMAEYIESYYQKRGKNILLSRENHPLGTAGAIKNAESLIQTPHFLVLNGDTYCQIDFPEFINFHLQNKALASLVLVPSMGSNDFGQIAIDESNRIVQFQEKSAEGKHLWYNAGIYIFDRRVLSLIPPQEKYSLEYNLFPKLLFLDFFGYRTQQKMMDIGTPQRYLEAQKYFDP